MGIGVYFSLSALIVIIILSYMFFSKQRIKNIETKIYSKILILTIIGLFLEVITYLWFKNGVDLNNDIYKFISKLTSSYYMLWSGLFVMYIMSICDTKRMSKVIFNIIYLISFIAILILPISYNTNNARVLPVGPSIITTYVMCFLYTLIDVYYVIKSRKKIKGSKFAPVYVLLVLGGFDIFLSIISPSLFLVGYVYSLIVIIMYFTIENPDVIMIEQLELARNQADKANKAKTEFLSNMSHEIRTPLNAIVGFSECMIEYPNLDEEIRGYAKDIVEASNNLLEIVNGILDISKIEANKMDVIPKDYNPREVFASLEKLIKPRIGDKPIEFKSFISSDIPGILNGDVSKLKQIILNILTNAAKYTEKGEIIFNVSCVNKLSTKKCTLFISVKDTGRGIKKENIDKLFNKFERLDEDKNTTMEGTGLGLAITKRLVALLGGKINVFSEYGKGSKFTIYLEQDIIEMEEPKEEIKETKIDYESFKGKKVLVVDDSSINLKVATQVLKPYNFELTTAISGFEAIEKVKEQTFDLILMDIMMPKMDGVETLKKLQEDKNFKIPTVALTADAIEGMDVKYISEGFSDYLSKPINKEELNRVINKYLKGN